MRVAIYLAFNSHVFAWLYVRVGILLTCGKHLHDRIMSVTGEIGLHKASLTPSPFIEVPVQIHDIERSCLLDFSCFQKFSIGFWNCSDSVWCLFSLSLSLSARDCHDCMTIRFTSCFTINDYLRFILGLHYMHD